MRQVTLRAGETLWMPRGTVHYARAGGSFSTHLTVSTHQRWRVAELLQFCFTKALQTAADDPANECLRRLPLRLRLLCPVG